MGKELTKAVLARTYRTLSVGHFDNRCDKCGKRLKLHPGGLILVAPRFTTCRSCGYDNPTLSEKVAERLLAEGYDLTDSSIGQSTMPQCERCDLELIVSRDFTKVFCRRCGDEWSVSDYEDILGGPISPSLAGRLPLIQDESGHATQLSQILEAEGVDYSTFFLVLPLGISDKPSKAGDTPSVPATESFGKSMFKAFAEGFSEGLGDEKLRKADKKTDPIPQASCYVAVFEEYVAKYEIVDGKVVVEEVLFADISNESLEPQDTGLNLAFTKSRDSRKYEALLRDMRMIFLANSKPYQEVIFGSAKKEAEMKAKEELVATPLADQVQKLAELHKQGLLSDEEFAAAKAKLLGI